MFDLTEECDIHGAYTGYCPECASRSAYLGAFPQDTLRRAIAAKRAAWHAAYDAAQAAGATDYAARANRAAEEAHRAYLEAQPEHAAGLEAVKRDRREDRRYRARRLAELDKATP